MIMCCCSVTLFAQTNTGKKQTSTNPVFFGLYADPEGVVFGDKYWIYPTYSAPFEQQLYMDAFSSPDLVHWRKHPKVLSVENISWLRNALWAPAVIEANGKYYWKHLQLHREHLLLFLHLQWGLGLLEKSYLPFQ